jgi:hypothetical protein
VSQAVVETAVHVTGDRNLYEIAFSALWPHLGNPDTKTLFQTMTLSLRFLDTHTYLNDLNQDWGSSVRVYQFARLFDTNPPDSP